MVFEHTVYIPDGDSRQETAEMLVGTASAEGINQQSITAVSGGFFITDELADIIYDEGFDPDRAVAEDADAIAAGADPLAVSPTDPNPNDETDAEAMAVDALDIDADALDRVEPAPTTRGTKAAKTSAKK